MSNVRGVSMAASNLGYSVMQFTFSLCFFSRIREFSEQQVHIIILFITTQLPKNVHLENITQYLVVYLIQYVRFESFSWALIKIGKFHIYIMLNEKENIIYQLQI